MDDLDDGKRAGKQNSNNRNFQFWQQHNKPIELTDNKIMEQKLNYSAQ
jgi:putative transposase